MPRKGGPDFELDTGRRLANIAIGDRQEIEEIKRGLLKALSGLLDARELDELRACNSRDLVPMARRMIRDHDLDPEVTLQSRGFYIRQAK